MPYFAPPNITAPLEMFTYTNDLTGLMLGPILLVVMFVILFISFKTVDTEKSFAVSVFITSVIGILMTVVKLAAPELAIVLIILTGFSVILLMFRN